MRIAAVAGILFTIGASLNAQTVPMKEASPGLLKKAKITADAATSTAMAKVPNGKLESREIEMKKNELVYAFAIKAPGKAKSEHVLVDANTGSVVEDSHQAAHEAKPAAHEKAKSPATKKH